MEKRPLRHAYMIITHGNFPILEKQLRFLDSGNADFFIHVDAKVRDFDFDRFRSIPTRSQVTFVPRRSIYWGHFSLVECELDLLRAAAAVGYDYYHLLSGVDVPVKTREYIEHFFDDADGMNYLNFEAPVISRRHRARVRYYYPFLEWNIRKPLVRTAVREAGVLLQKLAFVDRTRALDKSFVLQKGTQWFSVTDGLVRYVLSREETIRELFRSTYCPDEMFMQTIAVNSPFKDKLPLNAFGNRHLNCCRYIDWQRGRPYTFTDSDYDELIHTGPGYLFARKFDYNAFPGVVDRLFEHFSGPDGLS